MKRFLKFLMYAIDSVDGNRGSMKSLVKHMQNPKREVEEMRRKTIIKYNLMKVRSKISFQAFRNKETVVELILKQISKSYKKMCKTGCIEPTMHYPKEVKEIVEKIMEGNYSGTVYHLMEYNT